MRVLEPAQPLTRQAWRELRAGCCRTSIYRLDRRRGGDKTEQRNGQAREDFQLNQDSDRAESQFPPSEQGRNQQQVHDRRIDVERGGLQGVWQNLQNDGRLAQCLETVHRAPDSPPDEDASAPPPTDGCHSAGCRSHGQENRSQDDVDHIAAERCQFIRGGRDIHFGSVSRYTLTGSVRSNYSVADTTFP